MKLDEVVIPAKVKQKTTFFGTVFPENISIAIFLSAIVAMFVFTDFLYTWRWIVTFAILGLFSAMFTSYYAPHGISYIHFLLREVFFAHFSKGKPFEYQPSGMKLDANYEITKWRE